MKKILALVLLAACIPAFSQEEEGHAHGPDGRHIVEPQEAPLTEGGFILSHHDMRIEGPDGKTILGATVDSTIHRKGDVNAVIHVERNVYEPENEVYGSHMTYKEPGEYVLAQKVSLPDGRAFAVNFPVYVPALAEGAEEDEHAHGPNYLLIGGAIVGGLLLIGGTYRLGQRNARRASSSLLLVGVFAASAIAPIGWTQDDEAGHMHGPDGRHIVAPDAEKAAGPALRAFPAPNRGQSAQVVSDGIKFVLKIENEEMSPDPDLVALGAEKAKLIGLQTVLVQASATGGGLQTTGQVRANPNGLVVVDARASGRVVSLGALPGTTVQRGQTLAVIASPDLADAQAAYRRATAEAAQANASVRIAQSAVEGAETRLEVADRTLVRQRQLASAGAFASPSLEAARSASSEAQAKLTNMTVTVKALEVKVARLEQGLATGIVARREYDEAAAELARARNDEADARQQVAIAREALVREESITAKGIRTAREVEAAQAEVDLARNALQSARNSLLQARADQTRVASLTRVAADQIRMLGGSPGGGNQVTISAPISGEVEHRFVSVGQTVPAGQPLYDLLNAEVVWVLSDVYELDIPKVQVGQSVVVVADAHPDRTYRGQVAFIHNEVDEKTRTTKVRVVVDNPGERLKQNMFVRVQLGTGSAAQVTVPTAAVQTKDGLTFVFVEEVPGTYRRVIVQAAGTLGNRTIIKGGLESGKKVVTDGAYQLTAMGGGQ
jgi:multidrug efflux pump subunit AcrA (membrane-fusion protein)